MTFAVTIGSEIFPKYSKLNGAQSFFNEKRPCESMNKFMKSNSKKSNDNKQKEVLPECQPIEVRKVEAERLKVRKYKWNNKDRHKQAHQADI
jgi:hypothetical protein